MTQSSLKAFARGSFISLLGTGALGIINYFVRRCLCIHLSTTDFGIFYTSFSLMLMLYAFSDLGLSQSATTLIAKYAGSRKQYCCFNAFFRFRFILAFLFTIVIWLAARPLSLSYLHSTDCTPLLLMPVIFFFQSMSGCFVSLYNGRKEFGTLQIVQLVGGALLLIGVTAVGTKLTNVIYVFIATYFIVLIANALYCTLTQKVQWKVSPSANEWIELLKIGGWLAVSTTLSSSQYYMDTVMLTVQKGVGSAALYNVALPIMQIVQSLMIFPVVMLPVAVDMSKAGDFIGLRRFAYWGLLITLLLVPCCYLFFARLGKWLICFLFVEKYTAAAPAVPVLCTALLFFTLGNFLLQLLISLNRIKTIVLISVICFVANIALNYFLIRSYDFVGASWATLCSYVIFSFLSFIFVCKRGALHE